MIEQLHELIFPCNTTYQLTVIKDVVVALRMQKSNQLTNTEDESILSQGILPVWVREGGGSVAVWQAQVAEFEN